MNFLKEKHKISIKTKKIKKYFVYAWIPMIQVHNQQSIIA